MALTHNLGFPRIGKQRELKFSLEKYWNNDLTKQQLEHSASALREEQWQHQAKLDFLPVGDFSFYDHVLDTSFLLGNIPHRSKQNDAHELDDYFRAARGRASKSDSACHCNHATEMTKWFDTNYHYLVPEFNADTEFNLNSERLFAQIKQAKNLDHNIKPVLIGPITYLWLGKSKDGSNKLDLLEDIIKTYAQLLNQLKAEGIEWVQIDEPILVTELPDEYINAFKKAYQILHCEAPKILLTTYFGELKENLEFTCDLPVSGIHIDTINAAHEVDDIIQRLDKTKVLSLGVINGRNIWKTDLNKLLAWLKPINEQLDNRLWIAPSCSLLHVPVDLTSEKNLDSDLKSWLAFAIQKIEEITLIATALERNDASVIKALEKNQADLTTKNNSQRVHNNAVKARVKSINKTLSLRLSPFKKRAVLHKKLLNLPLYPTTTIGSFPQTDAIRKARRAFKKQIINSNDYKSFIQEEIKHTVELQEQLGIDVLVHGEAERNDMVEYFGEQLEGYAFSEFAWVQSYGSRCVKPPIIYGDISRPKAMTVEWIRYAQSLTKKPMKGMLTGPVTLLNWSFVRDDQSRALTCQQLALAIRDEVLDLEATGINIIQIDEAALREGLPLRQSQWQNYLNWAIEAYKISANGVKDETQIHTHMCYSEFNDIINAIADMDADVITIETSRSDMELLDVFDEYQYPNDIGPGVYDIHSPNIPSVEAMVSLIQKASKRIPAERLWVNPDCGLKTRNLEETALALGNMVLASKQLKQLHA